MKTLTFAFSATGTKRLPRGMKVYGMNMVPLDSTFAAGADGYACARLIDKAEGTADIDDDPCIFASWIASKANVMTIISNPPMNNKWILCSTPFLACVVSTTTVMVTIYYEDANLRQ